MTIDVSSVIHEVLTSPVVAALGVAFVVMVVAIPLSLKAAGLSTEQIVKLLDDTRQFILDTIEELRASNKRP